MGAERQVDEISTDQIDWRKYVSDQWVLEDRVSENVEHVVSVVRQCKWMDDRVEFDDNQSRYQCGAYVACHEEVLPYQPRK